MITLYDLPFIPVRINLIFPQPNFHPVCVFVCFARSMTRSNGIRREVDDEWQFQ